MTKTRSDKDNALLRMKNICSKEEKCIADITYKLSKEGFLPDEITEIISLLTKENFIHEERYAESFVRGKFRNNQWGKVKIGYELKRKGVPHEIIQKALESIDDETYISQITGLLQKKSQQLKSNASKEKKHKLLKFIVSKGYETEIAYALIKKVIDIE